MSFYKKKKKKKFFVTKKKKKKILKNRVINQNQDQICSISILITYLDWLTDFAIKKPIVSETLLLNKTVQNTCICFAIS